VVPVCAWKRPGARNCSTLLTASQSRHACTCPVVPTGPVPVVHGQPRPHVRRGPHLQHHDGAARGPPDDRRDIACLHLGVDLGDLTVQQCRHRLRIDLRRAGDRAAGILSACPRLTVPVSRKETCRWSLT
jgi:hypothetical protein